MTKTTNAEKVKKWRERRKATTEGQEQMREYERRKYEKRKRMGAIVQIKQLAEQDQKALREKWRVQKKQQREKQVVSLIKTMNETRYIRSHSNPIMVVAKKMNTMLFSPVSIPINTSIVQV